MREGFLRLGEDRAGFEIVSVRIGLLPEELTANLLWELWDIGSKFGRPSPKGLVFFQPPISIELYHFSDRGDGGIDGFAVFEAKKSGVIPMMGIPVLLGLKNGMTVMWDSNIIVREVIEVIPRIDEHAEESGFRKDGIRYSIPIIDAALN